MTGKVKKIALQLAEMKIPRKTTKTTFEETDKNINLVKAESADDLFDELEI